MADKNVGIEIKTTADTSGAQQAQRAMDDLHAPTKKVSEVFTTATMSAADTEEALKRVSSKAKPAGQDIAGMGRLATQAGFQITDFAVQVQGGQSAITAFSQQFPQLIGAVQTSGIELKTLGAGILSMSVGIGTAISLGAVAAGIGIQMVTAEYQKMTAAQDAAKKSAEANKKTLEGLADARQRVLNQQREEAIARLYRQQADDLERQENAMKRMAEIRAAEGALAGATAGAAVTAARQTGGDVAGAQLGQIGVETSNQLQSLVDALAMIDQRVEIAENDAIAAKMKLANIGDIYSDAYKAADETLRKAEIALGEAQADQATERQKFEIEKQRIAVTTGEALGNLSSETQAEITKQAQEIQQEVAAMAPAAFSGARVGLDQITKLLENGVIDPNEMAKLQEAMTRIRSSQEGRDKEIVTLLNSTDANMRAFIATMNAMNERQKAISEQVAELNRRVR
jgi:hypothetical protein